MSVLLLMKKICLSCIIEVEKIRVMKLSLETAIIYIQVQTGKKITGIQYEDGSGRKFNVMFAGASNWKFFEL